MKFFNSSLLRIVFRIVWLKITQVGLFFVLLRTAKAIVSYDREERKGSESGQSSAAYKTTIRTPIEGELLEEHLRGRKAFLKIFFINKNRSLCLWIVRKAIQLDSFRLTHLIKLGLSI